MPTIPSSHRDLLESAGTFSLATVGADGQPQVTAVWAMLDDDVVRTSLTKSRQKYKNLVAHPQVTLFAIDPANPQRTLEVRATAEVEEDPELKFLERLLRVYGIDLDGFGGPKNDRVVVTLHAVRVVAHG